MAGELSQADIDVIASKLIDGQFFIPEQVGLAALQRRFGNLNADDHPFHELERDNILPTSESFNIELTTKKLVENFRTVVWDMVKAEDGLWGR